MVYTRHNYGYATYTWHPLKMIPINVKAHPASNKPRTEKKRHRSANSHDIHQLDNCPHSIPVLGMRVPIERIIANSVYMMYCYMTLCIITMNSNYYLNLTANGTTASAIRGVTYLSPWDSNEVIPL
jgi:hypothetical protein